MKRTIQLMTMGLMAAGAANAALIADIGGDYVDATAAPAGWNYLISSAASGGTEAAMTANTVVTGGAGNSGFTGGQYSAILGSHTSEQYEIFTDGYDGSGTAAKNSATGNEGVVGTDLLFSPGNTTADAYVIARYTIGAADLVDGTSASIAGSFRNLVVRNTSNAASQGSVDVFIYKNTDLLWSVDQADDAATASMLSQTLGTYNLTDVTVAEGDTISFVVGWNGNNARDETALNGTINVIPEPATLGMVAVFGGGILFVRRRFMM
jgi:hypothetical protein